MKCPFLQETRVRYCHVAGIRKMLMQTEASAEERCSTPAFLDCAVYRAHEPAVAASHRCPFLNESHVQFCAAAAIPKLVPYSESSLIRCGSSGYRYCDVYLAFARPSPRPEECVDGLAVPGNLRYTPNHMWIDVAEDGAWRIGIDALLAHALGDIEAITFVTESGLQRPSAVFTVSGMDLTITFPHLMPIAGCNTYLRADPTRVVTAPYTHGWLFRGDRPTRMLDGLISGEQAPRWLASELQRASEFAHEQIHHVAPGMPADGGTLDRGFLMHLRREDRVRFCNAFFSHWAGRSDQ
jgi:glycine cleavage system H lipoate-binding protein